MPVHLPSLCGSDRHPDRGVLVVDQVRVEVEVRGGVRALVGGQEHRGDQLGLGLDVERHHPEAADRERGAHALEPLDHRVDVRRVDPGAQLLRRADGRLLVAALLVVACGRAGPRSTPRCRRYWPAPPLVGLMTKESSGISPLRTPSLDPVLAGGVVALGEVLLEEVVPEDLGRVPQRVGRAPAHLVLLVAVHREHRHEHHVVVGPAPQVERPEQRRDLDLLTYFKKGGIVATASTETNGVTIMPTGVTNDMSGLRASPVSSLEIR